MEYRIVVHCLAHAEAALAAAADRGIVVTLVSPPRAAASLGAAVFREMIALADARHPGCRAGAVLDCGDDAALALNALRRGVTAIRLDDGIDREVRRRIADIAAQSGAEIDEDDSPVLDLADIPDPAAACRDWLSRALEAPAP